jgi:hypothetical protein
MEIVLGIGMAMMMAVMGGPPKSAFLGGSSAEEGEAELEEAAGFVTTMREIPMEGAGNAEFAGEEHEGTEEDRRHVDASPENGEARQVDHDKERTRKRNTEAAMHKQMDYGLFRRGHNLNRKKWAVKMKAG